MSVGTPRGSDANTTLDTRAEGHQIEDEALSHITPLMRTYINPFGRYHFDPSRMRQDLDRSPVATAYRRFSVGCA
jgi:hypothetical protein